MVRIPEKQLGATGVSITLLGFGTAEHPFGSSPDSREIILHAIKLGYRHFDTAAVYQSEKVLGGAIADALRLGLVLSRAELFITSKVWPCDAHRDRVVPALKKTLENLGLDYLDLFLIHFPVSLKAGGCELPVIKEDLLPIDFKGVWEGMEECQRLGLTKSIGVSNFSCTKLQLLLSAAKIPPAVNQVEMNPVWQQKKLREFCEAEGIHVTAYSPLGGKGTFWGTNWVMESEVLKEIAQAKGKSIAQVCLRWVYEQGVSVVVKSYNKQRMEENLDIFDWELTPEEHHKISQIPQRKGYPGMDFVWEGGPFKSPEEFWDGEFA